MNSIVLLGVLACFALLLVLPRGRAICLFILSLTLISRYTVWETNSSGHPIFPTLEMVAVGIMAVRFLIRPGRPFDKTVAVCLTLFLFFAVLSCSFAVHPGIGFKIIATGGILPILAYRVVASTRLDAREQLWVCCGIVGIGLITTASIIWSYQYRQITDLSTETLSHAYGFDNPAILFGVPSVDGTILVMAIPFCVYFLASPKIAYKVLGGVGFVILVIGAALTLKRGTWVAALVAIALCVLAVTGKKKVPPFTRVLLVVLIVMFVSVPHLRDFASNLVAARSTKDGALFADRAVDARSENFALSLRSAVTFPVLGLGLGDYREIYGYFPDDPASKEDPVWFAHNLFLTLIPEVGLIGTLAYIGLYLHFVLLAYSRLRSPGYSLLAMCCGASIVAFLSEALLTGIYLVTEAGVPEVSPFLCPCPLVLFIIFGFLENHYLAATRVNESMNAVLRRDPVGYPDYRSGGEPCDALR